MATEQVVTRFRPTGMEARGILLLSFLATFLVCRAANHRNWKCAPLNHASMFAFIYAWQFVTTYDNRLGEMTRTLLHYLHHATPVAKQTGTVTFPHPLKKKAQVLHNMICQNRWQNMYNPCYVFLSLWTQHSGHFQSWHDFTSVCNKVWIGRLIMMQYW